MTYLHTNVSKCSLSLPLGRTRASGTTRKGRSTRSPRSEGAPRTGGRYGRQRR